jgi:hypothetical protein
MTYSPPKPSSKPSPSTLRRKRKSEPKPKKRIRHDGWTPERMRMFLDVLGHTGCVRDACRVSNMSSTSAYELRKRNPGFVAQWEAAIKRAGKGLEAVAYKHAVEGRETVIIRKGEEYERRIVPSDAMLALLIKRGKLNGELLSGETVITLDEWKARWRFNDAGKKFQEERPITTQEFMDKLFNRHKGHIG